MVEAVLEIKRWGNNLGVRLPAAVAREARLHAGQLVRVSVDGGQLIISGTVVNGWLQQQSWAPSVGNRRASVQIIQIG